MGKLYRICQSATMPIRILVADDHAVVRLGLKALLRETDIKIIGEATSGDEAVRAAKKTKADLVLLDVRMSGGDGLNALGHIKLYRQDLPVVLYSAFDNPIYVARAVALGAAGYLLKGTNRKTLLAALRKVADGKTLWTREELRRVTGALATPRLNLDVEVPLTQRECDVLKKLATGATSLGSARL